MIESHENMHGEHSENSKKAPIENLSQEQKGFSGNTPENPGENLAKNTIKNLEVENLKKRVLELETQLKEKDAKYLYLYAEFENFKKRSVKERSDL